MLARLQKTKRRKERKEGREKGREEGRKKGKKEGRKKEKQKAKSSFHIEQLKSRNFCLNNPRYKVSTSSSK